MFLFLALRQEYKEFAQKRDQSPTRMHIFTFPVCDIHGQDMKLTLSFGELLLACYNGISSDNVVSLVSSDHDLWCNGDWYLLL